MPKAIYWFRFSLRSLFVLTTLVSLLTFYCANYWHYHFLLRQVELGTFHTLSYSVEHGVKHKFDCRISLVTNWHDLLEQRTRENQKELQQLALLAIRTASYADKRDPQLVSLKNAIKHSISKEVGVFKGHELINEVVLNEVVRSEYSEQKKPRRFHEWNLRPAQVVWGSTIQEQN